jgi:protein arginine N-methyltransferase 3
MSIRLHPQDVLEDDDNLGTCLSSSDDDEDQNDPKTWDDWVSDSQESRDCYSLFEDKKLPSAAKAIEYDEQTHGFSLDRVSSKLGESAPLPIQTPFESKVSFASA